LTNKGKFTKMSNCKGAKGKKASAAKGKKGCGPGKVRVKSHNRKGSRVKSFCRAK